MAGDKNIEMVKDFIEYKKLRYNQNVVGIIFYGSRETGCYNEESDYDLLVIISEGEDRKIVEYFNLERFEYHERNLNSITDSFDKDYILLSILAHGRLMHDNINSTVKSLQKVANLRLKESLPELSDSDISGYIISIENSMREVKKSFEEKSDNTYFLCILTAEKIRKFYHRYLRIPPIREEKVCRVYTDKEYHSKNFFDIPIPEDEFISLYLKIISSKRNCKNNTDKLWKYCQDQINANKITYVTNNIRIYEFNEDDCSY